MLISVLKSKIAYAKVSDLNLWYVGSITIDSDLMKQANLQEYEKVQVLNLNNGERLETYVIAGEAGSGIFALNGPAARKAMLGDILFVLAYGLVDRAEPFTPALVDLGNR